MAGPFDFVFEQSALSVIDFLDRIDSYSDRMRLVHKVAHVEEQERRRKQIARKNDFHTLSDDDFHKRFRLTKKSVEYLTDLIGERLEPPSYRNAAITPMEQVFVALRFLATGAIKVDCMDISQGSCSRIVKNVTECIASLRPDFICMPETEEEREKMSQDFYSIAGFPCVLGVLDCMHVKILSPGGSEAERFRCRKGFCSLNIQTVTDPSLLIRDIVARWPGSTSNSTIYDNSKLKATLLSESTPAKYHLLGNDGYDCETSVMTPVSDPDTESEVRYNESLFLTRSEVEREYGVLKRRFPCLAFGLRCDLDRVPGVVVAAAVLHNMALKLDDPEPPISPEEMRALEATFVDEADAYIMNAPSGVAKRSQLINTYF